MTAWLMPPPAGSNYLPGWFITPPTPVFGWSGFTDAYPAWQYPATWVAVSGWYVDPAGTTDLAAGDLGQADPAGTGSIQLQVMIYDQPGDPQATPHVPYAVALCDRRTGEHVNGTWAAYGRAAGPPQYFPDEEPLINVAWYPGDPGYQFLADTIAAGALTMVFAQGDNPQGYAYPYLVQNPQVYLEDTVEPTTDVTVAPPLRQAYRNDRLAVGSPRQWPVPQSRQYGPSPTTYL